MKKLLTLSLILLLSGCVTYYYPQTALQDGVYYAEDDPSYVIDSGGYVGFSYYPWSSLDYFYLGYHPYTRFGFGYGHNYGYGSGWSVGFSYAYSPWYYPSDYYGFYSPWYASHYRHHYPAWRPYHAYNHGSYNHGNYRHGNKKHHQNNNDYRYAGNGHGNGNRGHGNRAGEYSDDVRSPTGRNRGNTYSSGREAAPVRKYVSTTPSGHAGNRGMEVRSRGSKNTGKTTKQPIRHDQVTVIKLDPSFQRRAQNKSRSRQSTGAAGEVRYRAAAKQDRSRTQPIESGSKVTSVAISTAPARPVAVNGNNGRNGHPSVLNASAYAASRAPSRQASTRGPTSPGSHPPAESRSRASSGNHQKSNSGSRSHSGRQSHASASSSTGRGSGNGHSPRRQHRK